MTRHNKSLPSDVTGIQSQRQEGLMVVDVARCGMVVHATWSKASKVTCNFIHGVIFHVDCDETWLFLFFILVPCQHKVDSLGVSHGDKGALKLDAGKTSAHGAPRQPVLLPPPLVGQCPRPDGTILPGLLATGQNPSCHGVGHRQISWRHHCWLHTKFGMWPGILWYTDEGRSDPGKEPRAVGAYLTSGSGLSTSHHKMPLR